VKKSSFFSLWVLNLQRVVVTYGVKQWVTSKFDSNGAVIWPIQRLELRFYGSLSGLFACGTLPSNPTTPSDVCSVPTLMSSDQYARLAPERGTNRHRGPAMQIRNESEIAKYLTERLPLSSTFPVAPFLQSLVASATRALSCSSARRPGVAVRLWHLLCAH
jgi:hypothetical protein